MSSNAHVSIFCPFRRLSFCFLTAMAAAAIQAVFIRGHETRSSPKPHTVYRIEVQASVRSWHLWRRYSEFLDLHSELMQATGEQPPAALPPKHASWTSTLTLGRSGTTTKDENFLRMSLVVVDISGCVLSADRPLSRKLSTPCSSAEKKGAPVMG